MISYGGTPLGVDVPADDAETDLDVLTLAGWLRDHFDPTGVLDAVPQQWGGGGWLGAKPTPLPAAPGWPVEPGVLHWPGAGASRFAIGWYLASQAQLDRIRPLVYGSNGQQLNALPLVLSDGNDPTPGGGSRTVTSSMWMLPPRPLARTAGVGGGDNGLWLLTLVDDRFRWRYVSSAVTVTDGTTTWAQLFAAVGTALGVTVNAETVPAAYLLPPGSLSAAYGDSLPDLLDAAAAATGMVVTRGYDGTVRVVSATTALASVAAQLPRWPVDAGGRFAFNPGD